MAAMAKNKTDFACISKSIIHTEIWSYLLLQHQKLYKIRDIVQVVRWPLIGFTALYRPKLVFFHVFQLSMAYRLKNIADREKVLLAKMFSSLGSTKVFIGSKLSHDPLKGLWPLICEKIVFSLLNIQTSSPLEGLHRFKLNLVWCSVFSKSQRSKAAN